MQSCCDEEQCSTPVGGRTARPGALQGISPVYHCRSTDMGRRLERLTARHRAGSSTTQRRVSSPGEMILGGGGSVSTTLDMMGFPPWGLSKGKEAPYLLKFAAASLGLSFLSRVADPRFISAAQCPVCSARHTPPSLAPLYSPPQPPATIIFPSQHPPFSSCTHKNKARRVVVLQRRPRLPRRPLLLHQPSKSSAPGGHAQERWRPSLASPPHSIATDI